MNLPHPSAPPVVPADLLPDAPSWPGPLGTASIIWGGLNLTCAGCGAFLILTPILMGSTLQQAFPDGMPPGVTNPPITIWINLALGSLLHLFLIASGIVLLLRKPIARPMHLCYAVAAVLVGLLGVWITMRYQNEVAQWVRDNPQTKYAQQAGAGAIIQTLGFALAVILAFTWPLFCIVWFAAVRTDSREIARGAETLV